MDRDSLVYKAKLAEQAERFDEMVQDMYVNQVTCLTADSVLRRFRREPRFS